MSRLRNRKVTIRLVGRMPDDPKELLDAIEAAFKPKEIELEVDCRKQGDSDRQEGLYPTIAVFSDEHLEQRVMDTAKTRLDELAEAVREHRKQLVEKAKRDVAHQRRSIAGWVKVITIQGYRLTVQAIVEAFHEIAKG